MTSLRHQRMHTVSRVWSSLCVRALSRMAWMRYLELSPKTSRRDGAELNLAIMPSPSYLPFSHHKAVLFAANRHMFVQTADVLMCSKDCRGAVRIHPDVRRSSCSSMALVAECWWLALRRNDAKLYQQQKRHGLDRQTDKARAQWGGFGEKREEREKRERASPLVARIETKQYQVISTTETTRSRQADIQIRQERNGAGSE